MVVRCVQAILIFLGLLLVLLGVLLSVRTGIQAYGTQSRCAVDLRYGVLRIPLYPRSFHHLKAKERQANEKKTQTARQKSETRSTRQQAPPIDALFEVIWPILREFAGKLFIRELRIAVMLATEDAAKTGILLGQLSALTGMAIPFLENTFSMRQYQIRLDADFQADKTKAAFHLWIETRPIVVGILLLRHSPKLYQFYKTMKTKTEEPNHE